jgi:hypothetical protein
MFDKAVNKYPDAKPEDTNTQLKCMAPLEFRNHASICA